MKNRVKKHKVKSDNKTGIKVDAIRLILTIVLAVVAGVSLLINNNHSNKKITDKNISENATSDSIGIGLALAKTIIEEDNGNISVESNKNGTKFTIKYFKL